jgi:hypothetical protein
MLEYRPGLPTQGHSLRQPQVNAANCGYWSARYSGVDNPDTVLTFDRY